MKSPSSVPLLLLLLSAGDSAVITGACDRDLQCGGGMCCAVSLWIRSLRMCTPMGTLGEDCHPLSHKVAYNTIQTDGREVTCASCANCFCRVGMHTEAICIAENAQKCAVVCYKRHKIQTGLWNGSHSYNQIPFWGKRIHHSCPCLPNLACVWISPSKYKCLPEFKNEDIFF